MATETRSKSQKAAEKAEAVRELRKLLKPGMTVYGVVRSVSASGMSRRIDFYVIRKGRLRFISGYVGRVLDYSRGQGDGLLVGGCGMDMIFHVVHSLGYALWGQQAEKDTGPRATALRRKLLAACRHYLMQGGRTQEPDPTVPAREWFGACGYALKHDQI